MEILEKISKAIDIFIRYFVGAILIVMFSLVVLQVLLRYVFHAPLAWTDETSRYLMTWMIFVGACCASREGTHLGVTILSDKCKGALRLGLLTIINILICGFLVVVGIQGYNLVMSVMKVPSPTLQISMAIPYISVPIGCFLMLFQTIVATLKLYTKENK